MRVARPSTGSLVVCLLLVSVSIVALRLSGPPAPAGDVTPEAVFSTARAMPDVRSLAEAPHPMGSAEHTKVRQRVVQRLTGLGFVVERQRTTAVRVRRHAGSNGTIVAGLVENVMVRLPGRENTGAILLACHYDSVAAGPGAADDTAAVASVLETLRALKAGPPLRNDVIALFTDGEEEGLLGAEAFVSRHPWARDVHVVLNFEARGNRGAVQMFETTPGNGPIVAAWAEAVPKPAGTSLAYEVYRRLPNDTDFTEFKRMNAVGLGFAFIGNVAAYHTPHDSADALDRWSVQGVGEAALGLVKHLGEANLDLTAWRGGDRVYVSLPGGWVVHHDGFWAVPLAVFGCGLWVGVLLHLRRRSATSFGGVILATVLMTTLAGGLAWAGLRVPGWIGALQARTLPIATPATSVAYAFSVVCLVLALWAALWALLRRKMAAQTLAMGGVAVLLLAGCAVAWWLPGGSYLLTWPAIAALPAVIVVRTGTAKVAIHAARAWAIGLLAVPALCLLVPTAVLVFDALLLTPEGVAGTVVLTTVGVFGLGTAVECVTEGRRWWPALLLTLLGLGALGAGVVTSAHGPRHPRPENVVYALDAGAGTAVWATAADPATPWLAGFVGETPTRGPLPGFAAVAGQQPFLRADAPVADLPAPLVQVERQTAEHGARDVVFRVTSPRGGRNLSLRMPEREVLETRVNGRPVVGDGPASWARGRWGLEFANVPAEGIDVVVRVAGMEPIDLVVADRSEGLPADLARGVTRPASSHPVHRGDITLVQRTFRF